MHEHPSSPPSHSGIDVQQKPACRLSHDDTFSGQRSCPRRRYLLKCMAVCLLGMTISVLATLRALHHWNVFPNSWVRGPTPGAIFVGGPALTVPYLGFALFHARADRIISNMVLVMAGMQWQLAMWWVFLRRETCEPVHGGFLAAAYIALSVAMMLVL